MGKPNVLRYTTVVRGEVTAAQALAVIQDHQLFINVDPNMVSYKSDIEPQNGRLHQLPDEIRAIATGETRCHEVEDKMPGVALFSKLLGGLSTVRNYYEITNTKEGVFIFLRAPLGVTEERRSAVVEEGGAVKIVEYVTIFSPRLLYGSVKSQQDLHWKDVHSKFVAKMGGEVGEQTAG